MLLDTQVMLLHMECIMGRVYKTLSVPKNIFCKCNTNMCLVITTVVIHVCMVRNVAGKCIAIFATEKTIMYSNI